MPNIRCFSTAKLLLILPLFLAISIAVNLPSKAQTIEGKTMENSPSNVTSITALLPVETVEPNAIFFEKIGFSRTNEVSENPSDPSTPLGFVIMVSGKTQVMLQSIQSIKNDAPELIPEGDTTSFLFVEVNDLDAVTNSLKGYPVFMERRTTFYGSEEIGITAPGGHKMTFAKFNR